jgi:2-polyprenyl-3-methyl-5-hydroxy-6-metoxy-1,4-benzoquinol methylase
MALHEPPEAYWQQDRAEIVELVPGDAQRIVDVGCARGYLGRRLKALGKREVIGIELNPEAAREAGQYLDRVYVGDAATMPEGGQLEPGAADCVIFGDVLEHLVDPWGCLRAYRRVVRPGGYIVVSLPNIRNYKIVRDLLKGRWDYTEHGILDRTHLRFFTRRGMVRLIEDAGFEILEVRPVIWASGQKRLVNRLLGGALTDFLVGQYVFLARRPM